MSFIAWLKKHVCEDDAWITVHPNAGGKGSPVLLDDEGYIKGGMGGKFNGQRIDLMPRKSGYGLPVSENDPLNKSTPGFLRTSRYTLKAPTPRDTYQEHLDAKHQRAVERAEKAEQEANAKWQAWHNMTKDVPLGQPIISKQMARFAKKASERADNAMAATQRANELWRKAETTGTSTAVSVLDNLATQKLTSKLEGLERRREEIKAVNKALKNVTDPKVALKTLDDMGVSRETRSDFIGQWQAFGTRNGFTSASYVLSNLGAEIRRVKGRIENIEKTKSMPSRERSFTSKTAGTFSYSEDPETMRSSFTFEGKPPAEVRQTLKSNGYRWSPSTGTWTRQLTGNARHSAKRIVQELGATTEVTQSIDSDFAQDSTPRSMTFDAAPSQRRVDENGFMHVDSCHVTKEQVVKYYGREIPGWRELGLDPERLYNVYRPGDEIEKAAATFDGLPLQLQHHIDSADEPQTEFRVGSISRPVWRAPYLDCDLHITNGAAISAVEHGDFKEISAAYLYEPVVESGEFEGTPYEIVMRNLRGNHVALVPKGRAGADVVVADEAPDAPPLRSFAAWMRKNPLSLKDAPSPEWEATRNALDNN